MDTDVSVTFVEFGKYNEGKHKGTLDQWLYTLKNIETLDGMPDWITDGEIQEFYNKAEFAKMPISVREQIQTYMTTELDWKNAVIYAGKKYFKKGLAEGKAEGKAEGFVEGEAKGKTEGKAERNIEIAKAMKLAGEPVEKIILYSGLTMEQIEAL